MKIDRITICLNLNDIVNNFIDKIIFPPFRWCYKRNSLECVTLQGYFIYLKYQIIYIRPFLCLKFGVNLFVEKIYLESSDLRKTLLAFCINIIIGIEWSVRRSFDKIWWNLFLFKYNIVIIQFFSQLLILWLEFKRTMSVIR